MVTMDFLVWLPVILFIVHEFEEIIMAEAWFLRNEEKIQKTWPRKQPFGLNFVKEYRTASIAIGIFSEFLFLSSVTLLCAIFQNYYAWYGGFIGFTLHLLSPHVSGCLKFKGYLPGMLTAAIVFVPSVWVLYRAAVLLDYGVVETLLSTVVMFLVSFLVTFGLLHKSMTSWSRSLARYARADAKANS